MDFVGRIGWDRKMRTDSPSQRAKTGNFNEEGNLMGMRTRGAMLGSKLPSHNSRLKIQQGENARAVGQRSMLRTLPPTFVSSESLRRGCIRASTILSLGRMPGFMPVELGEMTWLEDLHTVHCF